MYNFPAILHDAIKRKLEPMFDALGLTAESKVPTRKGSILSLVSVEDLVTLSGPGWTIHKTDYKREGVVMCEMRLISQTEVPTIAGQRFYEAVVAHCRRIGVLNMPERSHVGVVKKKMEILVGQNDELLWEIVDQTTPYCLVIGGTFLFWCLNMVANLNSSNN